MKIYVSLPITGYHLAERKLHAKTIKDYLLTQYKRSEVVTPFDICDEESRPYSYYMGKDLETLLECDAVCFCSGWQSSQGCSLEYEAAKIYDKKMYFL